MKKSILILCWIVGGAATYAQNTVPLRIFNMINGSSFFRTGDDVYLEIPKHKHTGYVSADTRDRQGNSAFRYSSDRKIDTLSTGTFNSSGLYTFQEVFLEKDDSTNFVEYIKIKPEDSLRYIYYQLPGRGFKWTVGHKDSIIEQHHQFLYCYSSRYTNTGASSMLLETSSAILPDTNVRMLMDTLFFAQRNVNQEKWKDSLTNLRKKYGADSLTQYQYALYVTPREGLRLFVTDIDATIPIQTNENVIRCAAFLCEIINIYTTPDLSLLKEPGTDKVIPLISKDLAVKLCSIADSLVLYDPSTFFFVKDAGNTDEALMEITDGSHKTGSDSIFAGFIRKDNSDQFIIAVKIVAKKKTL